jgi:hypothetical protein
MSRSKWTYFTNISFMIWFSLYLDQNLRWKFMYLPNMVRGWEEKYIWAKKLLEYAQKWYDKHANKTNGMWNLRLGNTCGWMFGI